MLMQAEKCPWEDRHNYQSAANCCSMASVADLTAVGTSPCRLDSLRWKGPAQRERRSAVPMQAVTSGACGQTAAHLGQLHEMSDARLILEVCR